MAASFYSPVDSMKGEIRLLMIEPAPSQQHPLICYLQPAFLSEDGPKPSKTPEFEALSYTWGLPGVSSDMQLDGQAFPMQENAAAALRRLRFTDKKRTMWVDAICINQADIHEKEGQLVLMRKIYEQAAQVCVWLGEPTESTILAIQDLQNTVGVAPTATVEKSVINNYMATLLGPSHPVRNITNGTAWQWSTQLDLELDFGDLRELLSRPWWSRVWVIQEAVVGKRVTFMVGDQTFEWESMERSLDRIRKGKVLQGVGAVEMFGVVVNPELYSAQDETYQLISRLRTRWHSGNFNLSIYELLYDFRHLQCTNQRDRVFGCLGLATACGEFPDIQPDYSSSTRDIYVKTALSIIKNTGTLDIFNCVRDWRGLAPLSKPPQAFSLPDQAKYHDVGAMVTDGPGTPPRRGWARLPSGWERVPSAGNPSIGPLSMFKTLWKGKSARYYDHNTNTVHDSSPLEGTEPQVSRHPARQRELPPGWTKTWDNLGRAIVSYDPRPSQSPRIPQGSAVFSNDHLESLPSWVPNWSAITPLDPRPLLPWSSSSSPHYNACASKPADVISSTNSTLTVRGYHLDTVLASSQPWHPTSPAMTRRFAPVLAEWEHLALDTSIFSPHPCPYSQDPVRYEEDRKTALWRTYLADTAIFPARTTRPLMDAWYDRSEWGKQLPTLEETTGRNLWEASGAEIDVKYQHWDLHGELRRAEGDGYKTSKQTDEAYAAVIKRVGEACANRLLFVTERGYIGLGPWRTKAGDQVVVLKGGRTPFLVREAREGTCVLVGEVFVCGIMEGEGVRGEERRFCLV